MLHEQNEEFRQDWCSMQKKARLGSLCHFSDQDTGSQCQLICPGPQIGGLNADLLTPLLVLFPLLSALGTWLENRAIKQFKAQGENLTYRCTFLLTSNKTQAEKESCASQIALHKHLIGERTFLLVSLITLPLPFPRNPWWQSNYKLFCVCTAAISRSVSISQSCPVGTQHRRSTKSTFWGLPVQLSSSWTCEGHWDGLFVSCGCSLGFAHGHLWFYTDKKWSYTPG